MLTDPFYEDITVAIIDAENFELTKHLSLNDQLVSSESGRARRRFRRLWLETD